MTRYLVIGAGAIGSTVAAQLALAGVDVVVAARGPHLDALRSGPLRYVRPDGEHRVDLFAVGGPDEVSLDPDDVLLVTTKSQDTGPALDQWAWAPVGSSVAALRLPIVLLQNGMENERTALRRFDRVYGAMVSVPATYLEAGSVISPAPMPGAFWLGQYPQGSDETATRIAADLHTAGFETQVVDDVIRWKASKLVMNLGNALDALFPRSPRRDEVREALEEEGRRILAAVGIDPADRDTESRLDLSGMRTPPDAAALRVSKHSSTWQSLARGTGIESDYLNGEIVLLAREHGRAAPLNQALQVLVASAARDHRSPGSLGDEQLENLLAVS